MVNEILPLLQFGTFTDVFCGGGSISLAYAQKFRPATITMNDLDKFTYAIWDVVVNGSGDEFEELSTMVLQTPTIDLFNHNRTLLETTNKVERAYLGIFFHKCTFSGLFNGSPIGGQGQNSQWKVGCHYNPKLLLDKMLKARRLLSGKTTVTNLDYKQLPQTDVMYYDPPYVSVGDKLYSIAFDETKHRELSEHLHKSTSNWLLSYNDHPLVRELYSDCKIVEYKHTMSMTSFCEDKKCRVKTELLITK